MFYQDTLDHPFSGMDVVVCDLPGYKVNELEDKYFPYLCVLQHLSSLKENGYFIGVVPNDFFEYDEDNFFKANLKKYGSVLGVLELPTNMFKSNPKSIIIFSRVAIESKKCLVVQLPSFTNQDALNEALIKIEQWFEINKKEVK